MLRAEARRPAGSRDSRAPLRDRSRAARRRRRPARRRARPSPRARWVAFSTWARRLSRSAIARRVLRAGVRGLRRDAAQGCGRRSRRPAWRLAWRATRRGSARQAGNGRAPRSRRRRRAMISTSADQQPRAPAHAFVRPCRSFRGRLVAQPLRQGPAARRRSGCSAASTAVQPVPTASAAAALIAAIAIDVAIARRARQSAAPARGEWISATLPG